MYVCTVFFLNIVEEKRDAVADANEDKYYNKDKYYRKRDSSAVTDEKND